MLSLPYDTSAETRRLDEIQASLGAALVTNDWPAVVQLLRGISLLLSLKVRPTNRAAMVALLFELATSPTSDAKLIDLASGLGLKLLKTKVSLDGQLSLDWRPLHAALERILHPKVLYFTLANSLCPPWL